MKLSLRAKLLAILILVPSISLTIFAFRAINLVTQDKKAYIFDSAVIIAKALATQTRIELDFFDGLTAPIFEAIDTKAMKFGRAAYEVFKNQKRIEYMFLFSKAPSGAFVGTDQMYLPQRTIKTYTPGGETLDAIIHAADESGFAIQDVPDAKRYFLIAVKRESPDKTQTFVLLSLYSAVDLYEAFAAPSAYRSYLVTKYNFLAMGPKFIRQKKWREQITTVDFFKPIFNNRFPVGTAEIVGANGDPMLVSFAEVGRSGMLTASVVEKKAALGAVRKLFYESGIMLVTLLALMILISIVASLNLTSALQQLVTVTKQIASGKYNIRIGFESGDEVGELAKSITVMAEEVVRSIAKTAENARLTSELNTVKLVQEMMFPKESGRIGPFDIQGYFNPASECGGDWYSYSQMGDDRLFLWIGDVTGHGASAALITAAAKSVSAVIEVMPDITPAMALKLLNHAIASTSKGQVLMTFALLSIDLKTGVVTYSLASHEPPYVLPKKDDLKKKDFIPLVDVSGPRLGESLDSEYEEAQYQLSPGDMIFLYTDGLMDLSNAKGEALGERQVIKMISECFRGQSDLKFKLEAMKEGMSVFRGDTPLKDDLTILTAQYLP